MSSTAARVAGYLYKTGGHWGQSTASLVGAQSDGVTSGTGSANAILVEANLGTLGWTRIPVRYESGITVQRGRAAEGQVADTQTATFTIDNRTGYWSPRNPNSPYYGYLGRNTPVRIWKGSQFRFMGELSEWPQRWDPTGSDVYVTVTASGVMRRIGNTANVAQTSALYDMYTGAQGILNASGTYVKPVAYWPMEDAVGSSSLASAVQGVSPMHPMGSPALAQYTQFGGSSPLPAFGGGIEYSAYAPSGMSSNGCVLDFVLNGNMHLETQATALVRLIFSGGSARYIDISMNVSGTDAFFPYLADDAHTSIGAGAQLGADYPPITINPMAMQIVVTQQGSQIGLAMYAKSANDALWTNLHVTNSGLWPVANTLGRLTQVWFNPPGTPMLSGYVLGHVAVFDDTVGHEIGTVACGYVSESAGTRFSRVLTQQGYTPRIVGQDTISVPMGAQVSDSTVSTLRTCEAADSGMLFEARDLLTPAYRTTSSLANQQPVLTLNYANGELSGQLNPTDDDQLTKNDVTVSRAGGSSARFIDSTSSMGTPAPPNGVGVYQGSANLVLADDTLCASLASWMVHTGTVNESRYPQVNVSLQNPRFVANPDLASRALVADVGDRLVIKNPPAWLPPDDISLIILGYTETFDQFYHTITFNCMPESPFHTASVQSAAATPTTTSVKTDSAYSTVSADNGSTMSVSVASPGALWSTSGVAFDIMVNGERITVTGVSGSSSPQTFTVTRSVNGVVKTHAPGEKVTLFRPSYVALPSQMYTAVQAAASPTTLTDVANGLATTNTNVTTVQNSVPILRSYHAHSSGNVASFTTSTAVTGATVSPVITGSSATVKVWAEFDFSCGAAATFTGHLQWNGADQSEQAIFICPTATGRATVAQSWEITGVTPGTYTASLFATCSVGSASNVVEATHTGVSVLVIDTQT